MRKIKALLTAVFAILVSVSPIWAADFLPQKYVAAAYTSEGLWWYIGPGNTDVGASDEALLKCLEATSGCIRGPVVEGDAIFASFTCPSFGKTVVALTREGDLAIDTAVLEVVSEREFYTECKVFTENFGGTIVQWSRVEDPFYFD